MLLLMQVANAQKKWDGGGGTGQWADALNWNPDGVPGTEDDVVLDNQLFAGNYAVELPTGSLVTLVKTLRITPSTTTISVILPSANTAVPGFKLSGTEESLIVDNGGTFVNASGASSGSPLQLAGKMRVNNGGKYVHRTPRGNAELIDKLISDAGTENGIFEFDVPGTSGYTVSLTGNTFGSLVFRASAAGGAKSYSGSGSSGLNIRGHLVIEHGALLTSTLTSDIILGGDLIVNGILDLHPVTTGTTGRSFVFGGKDVVFQGSGTLSMNAFFRNLLVAKNASLTLETPCHLSLTPNTLICHGQLYCKGGYVGGPGSFLLSDEATILIGSNDGIWQSADRGDIRTTFRNFSSNAKFQYVGTSTQITGDGLPDSIAVLSINNSSQLELNKPVAVTQVLELLSGKIKTDAVNMLTLFHADLNSPVNLWGEINSGWDGSFVEGPVRFVTRDSTWRTLPLGAGKDFAPIKLRTLDGDLRTLTVEYKSGPNSNSTILPSLNRLGTRGHYLMSGIGTGNWQTTLSFIPADSVLATTESMTMAILQDLNGELKWGNVQASLLQNVPGASAGYGWLRSDSALSGFEAMAIGYVLNSLLPLELLEFTARNTGRYNQVSWRANQDGKDVTYILERSEDGRFFNPVFEIFSPKSTMASHQWNDNTPLSPFGYYRLLVKNGTGSIYSAVVKVSYNKPKAMLYPNPARDWIIINFSKRSSDTELEVVNMGGSVLRKAVVNNDLFHIRVSDLRPGFFFVRIRSSGEIITLPFTKY
jgi:hypothetical protein